MRNIYLFLSFIFFQTGFSQANILDWATYFGDANLEVFGSVYLDGELYIAGRATGNSLNMQDIIDEQSFQASYGGGRADGFIAKISEEGQPVWFTYYGNEGDDYLRDITTDGKSIYIVGNTTSNNMASPAAYQSSINGASDGYIACFNVDGDRLWHTYFGGEGPDSIHSITYHEDNLYVYGTTESHSYIATEGAFQETIARDGSTEDYTNNFLAKFNKNGQAIWATYYGRVSAIPSDGQVSYITGISANETGLYIAGWDTGTQSRADDTNYFGTPGAFLETSPVINNTLPWMSLYLSKFSFDGERLWSTYFYGYNSNGIPNSILPIFNGNYINDSKNIVATSNGVYLSGNTVASYGIGTDGSFQPYKTGANVSFINHFSDTGERLWGSYLGNGGAGSNFLTSDSLENIIISGSTNSSSDISTTDAYQTQPNGELDLFMARISPDGTSKTYGTYYGGNDREHFGQVVIENEDIFYLIGMSRSSGLATEGAYQEELLDSENILIARFISESLSVKDFNKDKFALYPNPNDGNFIISSEAPLNNVSLEVFDMLGRKVYSHNIAELETLSLSLNLPIGTYILKLTTEKKTVYTNKILINK